MTILAGASPGIWPAATTPGWTGSPAGPTRPGISFPGVARPNGLVPGATPPVSGVAHPPPRPASNTNAFAVRFMDFPRDGADATIAAGPCRLPWRSL